MQVIWARDVGEGHPEYYQDMAEHWLLKTVGIMSIVENAANPKAETTGGNRWGSCQRCRQR